MFLSSPFGLELRLFGGVRLRGPTIIVLLRRLRGASSLVEEITSSLEYIPFYGLTINISNSSFQLKR